MEAREGSNQEDIDSKRPGGVALAAIWLMISSGASFVSVLMSGHFSGLSIALIVFSVIGFLTPFAVIALKKDLIGVEMGKGGFMAGDRAC